MFARIAHRYDVANRLLSGGADLWWRRRLVNEVKECRPIRVLDLATGSGDVAFSLARAMPHGIHITGMDFCRPMLDEAESKKGLSQDNRYACIEFQQGDGMALPLAAESYDAVTLSFGLRNMANRGVCLQEIHRVLKPGGCLFILEFSQAFPWFRPLYLCYLRHILPVLAGWVTGDRDAYVYLNESIESFPSRAELSGECRKAGFSAVTAAPMMLGIVALHKASK
ncbi:MAG: ubiquinone/menaquinone biosynthesis methyltransferase [Opitutaceae bacterium]|jgi:demethylmenaquinone methyltransferase/2-methoxy-6-polyprenyl-1,4-benzoquinol methylase